jgi:hypothetical protein
MSAKELIGAHSCGMQVRVYFFVALNPDGKFVAPSRGISKFAVLLKILHVIESKASNSQFAIRHRKMSSQTNPYYL